jgi:SAM-dependent methyltransferase
MGLLRGRRATQDDLPEFRKTLPGTRYPEAGQRYLRLFIELAGLQADHAVLEPGCGSGRMAAPLAGYLSPSGSYDGFDVLPEAIEACEREIGSQHPNFRFRHVDVYNRMYNPDGRLDPESFAFPYADESFDLVFLTSVFTHMLPPQVRHYLSEIRRVLQPSGRCLMTFFLLDAESLESISDGRAKRSFAHEGDGYLYDSAEVAERAVAYREEDALSLIDRAGLALDGPIRHGRWRHRGPAATAQDVIVVRRADAAGPRTPPRDSPS